MANVPGDMTERDIQARRSRAARTALVLGLIAVAIFAAFIGSAVLGR